MDPLPLPPTKGLPFKINTYDDVDEPRLVTYFQPTLAGQCMVEIFKLINDDIKGMHEMQTLSSALRDQLAAIDKKSNFLLSIIFKV